jgi:hypothetical protein
MGKKSGSGIGSGMNKPDHISQSLGTIFWVKILKFFDADPGSGMEKIRIRDKHPGSATLLRSDPICSVFRQDPQSCKRQTTTGSAVLQEANNNAGSSLFLTLIVAESTVFCRLKFDAVVWLLLVRGTAVGGPETTAATAN